MSVFFFFLLCNYFAQQSNIKYINGIIYWGKQKKTRNLCVKAPTYSLIVLKNLTNFQGQNCCNCWRLSNYYGKRFLLLASFCFWFAKLYLLDYVFTQSTCICLGYWQGEWLTKGRLVGSTNQAYSSGFYFRIAWKSTKQPSFLWNCSMSFLRGLRSTNIK